MYLGMGFEGEGMSCYYDDADESGLAGDHFFKCRSNLSSSFQETNQ